MPSARVKKGDVVVVTSEHSDYAGQIGTVESLTKTRLSARLLFESGNRATVRIGSLEVHPERAVPNSSIPQEVAAEVRRLREEVAEMKAVLLRLERLLLDDGGFVKDDEVMVLVRGENHS